MFTLAAAVLATTAPHSAGASAVAQATATIRVVTAVRLKLDAPDNPGAPTARNAVVRLGNGAAQPAKLIEFQ
jgi:hypothetical protein